MADRTLYDVLNVSPGAEPEVIEAAYRALMKKYHPDRFVGSEAPAQRASEVNGAFAVLRDRRARAEYDQRLRSARVQPAAAAAPRAAAFQPPPPVPPRGFNIAAWSGWGVALGFACFAAAMPLDPSMPARIPPAQSIASLEADEDPEPALARPAQLIVPLDPDGLTVQLRTLEEALRQQASARPPAAIASRGPDRHAAVRPPAPGAARIASASPRREPPRRTRQSDREFLEREGFIY